MSPIKQTENEVFEMYTRFMERGVNQQAASIMTLATIFLVKNPFEFEEIYDMTDPRVQFLSKKTEELLKGETNVI